jgi:hypothetical protein
MAIYRQSGAGYDWDMLWERLRRLLKRIADGEYERNMTGKPRELMTPADWRNQNAFWRLVDWFRSRHS